MIRVEKAERPPEFDAAVGEPGRRAMLELIGSPEAAKRPGPKRKAVAKEMEAIPVASLPDLWTIALPMLRIAYQHTCAYSGFRIDLATGNATVDHFVPKSASRARAYDWDNFRLSSGQMNTNKGDHQDVLDPFEVQDGWFALDLGSFEVGPEDTVSDPELRAAIVATITRLKLNDPVYCDARQTFFDRYFGLQTEGSDSATPWPFEYVRAHAPYVAAELRRQGRLRPEDR